MSSNVKVTRTKEAKSYRFRGLSVMSSVGVLVNFDKNDVAMCTAPVAETFRGLPGYTVDAPEPAPSPVAVDEAAPARPAPEATAEAPTFEADASDIGPPASGPADTVPTELPDGYDDLLALARSLGYAPKFPKPKRASVVAWLHEHLNLDPSPEAGEDDPLDVPELEED